MASGQAARHRSRRSEDAIAAEWPSITTVGIRDNDTAALAEQNLRTKLTDTGFRQDLDQLVSANTVTYDIDAAAELVIDQLLGRLDK